MVQPSSARNPIDKVAEEFIDRFRRGERPSLTEFTSRHPEIADKIRELFPALVMMEEVKSALSRVPEGARGGNVGSEPPKCLGEYRILREVGRGGMGIVYEAIQESLGRHVALKVLPFHCSANPMYLKRFERESRAAAALHHSNIVPVFGVGRDSGIHYYAMQFIDGQGLDEVMREVRRLRAEASGATPGQLEEPNGADVGITKPMTSTLAFRLLGQAEHARKPNENALRDGDDCDDSDAMLDETQPIAQSNPSDAGSSTQSHRLSQSDSHYYRSIARIGAQVADAIQYAHQQGILHRDIKPSNLLLDTHGVAWVTDFGLAKQDAEDLTHTGDMVGTMRYMAPERFRGESDSRSDIYALGITLYELLTLQPAFTVLDRAELIRQVADEEPRRPRRLDPRVPLDLETIVLKAIQKEPSRRYQTAQAMLEDLDRFLAYMPIQAQRPTAWQHFSRWCQRNPAVAVMSAVAIILLIAVSAVSSVAAVQLRRERDVVRMAKDESDRNLWEAYVLQATARRRTGLVGQRFESLAAIKKSLQLIPPDRLSDEELLRLRNEAIACFALADVEVERQWPFPKHHGSFSSDLARFATSDDEGNALIRDLATNETIGRVPGRGRPISDMRFTRDGRFLAAKDALSPDRSCHVWDLTDNSLVLDLRVHGSAYDFSDDGRLIAVGLTDGSIQLFDLLERREWKRLRPSGSPFTVRFSPDGNWLALNFESVPGHTRKVEIWDVNHATLERTLTHPGVTSWWMNWSSDSRLLAVPSYDFNIYVWDVISERQISVLRGHQAEVMAVTFCHGGELLASRSWDGTTRLWDPISERQLLLVPGYGVEQYPGFGPKDQQLGYHTHQHVGIWKVATGRSFHTIPAHEKEGAQGSYPSKGPWSVDFSSDGRLIVSAGDDAVRIHDAVTRRELATLPVTNSVCAFFHQSNQSLITASSRGLLQWPLEFSPDSSDWKIGPPKRLATSRAHSRYFRACVDAKGRRLALVSAADQVTTIDLTKPANRVRLTCQPDVAYVAISPDGQWVATGGKQLEVWDAATGARVKHAAMSMDSKQALVTFSPDGKWLVVFTGVPNHKYQVFEVGSWKLVYEIKQPPSGFGWKPSSFAPDGSLLAVGMGRTYIRLLIPSTGREVARLECPNALGRLCFSPDGTQLAAAGSYKIFIWDLHQIRQQLADMGLDWDTPRSAESAESKSTTPSPAPRRIVVELGEAWSDIVPLPEMHRRASTCSARNQFGKAAELYRQILEVEPDDALACNNLAWLLVTGPQELRDPTAAVPLAQRAAEADRTSYLNTLAMAYYRVGDYHKAIDTLDSVMSDGASDGTAYDWFVLAMCHYQLEETERAIQCYDRAIAWWRDGLSIGHLLDELRSLRSEAADMLGMKADRGGFDPDTFLRCRQRGDQLAEQGKWGEAADQFQMAVELGPPDGVVWVKLCLLRLMIGDQHGYSASCSDLIRRYGDCDDYTTLWFIAHCCTLGPNAMDDWSQATRLAVGMAENVRQPRSNHYRVLARLFARAGRFDESLEQLRQLQGGECSVSDRLFVGLTHEGMGHTEEARSCWKQFIQESRQSLDDPARHWKERLELQLYLREAQAVLASSAS